ncbi:hypothetical protein TruAng_011259 [Truncatella angustata]|nr:hypothetical protein TruAng_011259 [Truncatella angustata]
MDPPRHITRLTCARKDSDEHPMCSNIPEIDCPNCGLVKYCSDACRNADKSGTHQILCGDRQSAIREPEAYSAEASLIPNTPFHVDRSHLLFSSWPAYNVLSNVQRLWDEDEIHVLQAASGDLSTLMKTIAETPNGSKAKLYLTLNDREFIVCARNLITLLICMYGANEHIVTTAEVVTHLTYSAFLPDWVLRAIEVAALPTLTGLAHSVMDPNTDHETLVHIKLPFGQNKDKILEIVLSPATILGAAALVSGDGYLRQSAASAKAAQDRVRQNPNTIEIGKSKPEHKTAKVWFAQFCLGTLIPISGVATEFGNPNPTMFVEGQWVDMGAQPVHGCDIAELDTVKCHAGTNDLYGRLFYHTRGLVAKFIKNLLTGDKVKCIKIMQHDFETTSPVVLQKEYSLIDLTNLDKTMRVKGFVDMVKAFSSRLVDLPKARLVYRYRLEESNVALAEQITNASAGLGGRSTPVFHNGKWSTYTSPPQFMHWESQSLEVGLSAGEEGMNTSPGSRSPGVVATSTNSNNIDQGSSKQSSPDAAPSNAAFVSTTATTAQATASASGQQREDNNVSGTRVHQTSLNTAQSHNEIRAEASDEHPLTPVADTAVLLASETSIDTTSSSEVLKATMSYHSGPNNQPEDVFIPAGAYIPPHVQAQQQQQTNPAKRRRTVAYPSNHTWTAQVSRQYPMDGNGGAYDPTQDEANLTAYAPPPSLVSIATGKTTKSTKAKGSQTPTSNTAQAFGPASGSDVPATACGATDQQVQHCTAGPSKNKKKNQKKTMKRRAAAKVAKAVDSNADDIAESNTDDIAITSTDDTITSVNTNTNRFDSLKEQNSQPTATTNLSSDSTIKPPIDTVYLTGKVMDSVSQTDTSIKTRTHTLIPEATAIKTELDTSQADISNPKIVVNNPTIKPTTRPNQATDTTVKTRIHHLAPQAEPSEIKVGTSLAKNVFFKFGDLAYNVELRYAAPVIGTPIENDQTRALKAQVQDVKAKTQDIKPNAEGVIAKATDVNAKPQVATAKRNSKVKGKAKADTSSDDVQNETGMNSNNERFSTSTGQSGERLRHMTDKSREDKAKAENKTVKSASGPGQTGNAGAKHNGTTTTEVQKTQTSRAVKCTSNIGKNHQNGKEPEERLDTRTVTTGATEQWNTVGKYSRAALDNTSSLTPINPGLNRTAKANLSTASQPGALLKVEASNSKPVIAPSAEASTSKSSSDKNFHAKPTNESVEVVELEKKGETAAKVAKNNATGKDRNKGKGRSKALAKREVQDTDFSTALKGNGSDDKTTQSTHRKGRINLITTSAKNTVIDDVPDHTSNAARIASGSSQTDITDPKDVVLVSETTPNVQGTGTEAATPPALSAAQPANLPAINAGLMARGAPIIVNGSNNSMAKYAARNKKAQHARDAFSALIQTVPGGSSSKDQGPAVKKDDLATKASGSVSSKSTDLAIRKLELSNKSDTFVKERVPETEAASAEAVGVESVTKKGDGIGKDELATIANITDEDNSAENSGPTTTDATKLNKNGRTVKKVNANDELVVKTTTTVQAGQVFTDDSAVLDDTIINLGHIVGVAKQGVPYNIIPMEDSKENADASVNAKGDKLEDKEVAADGPAIKNEYIIQDDSSMKDTPKQGAPTQGAPRSQVDLVEGADTEAFEIPFKMGAHDGMKHPVSTNEKPIYARSGAKIKPGCCLGDLSALEKDTARTWEETVGKVPMRAVP